MDYILKEKIKIGISGCNFGAQVRWNHRGWDRVALLGDEKNEYIWTSVCPEVFSGFGVPRSPIRLVSGSGDDFWLGKAKMKNRKGRDVSEQMKKGALVSIDILKSAGIEAFAFMEGSPSCGVYRTTLKEKRLGRPPGAFGALLLQQDWFLFPAGDLESPWKWWDWSRRLHAFVWLKRQEIKSKKELYEAWHLLKFICQEVNDNRAREIGTQIAQSPKKLSLAYIDAWKKEVMQLIRQPSTLPRINASLLKHYAHFRKYFGYKTTDVQVPASDQGKKKFVEKLRAMEKQAFERNYQFSGHPIIYRPPRNT